ncbi:vacuolar protein sorting-associated protein 8 homolog [Sitodiplosis mosellana]|uniref:vacuolar protein sorting-associated protein 8 homolog n=1 Tax=Sitodiplosis mosellana TaxID=263140 RepID=UPI00244477A0|nr:vacuolar protein sorting-associated protein 8 homolog [Sitodiplosis mosellana]
MNTLKAPSLQSLLDSDRGSNDSLLAESLQLDLDELDDAEYSIPHVDMMPSLESILSELDTDSDIISDVSVRITPTPSIDDRPKTGTMLRHVLLQGVTSQITSASERINSGLATSVAVSDMIAVGTSHGHIMAFDILQALRWCCQEYLQQGAVTSLAFNEESTRLLAGFARGYIVMIDTSTGDSLRVLSDAITPNSGVLNIKWTGKPTLALCSDTGGSVWSLSFTRRLGKRGCDSKCLFSGARGEVCSIEPLIIDEEDHPLKSYCIVALATLSKFFVVMIRPRLKVIKFHPLQGPPDSLPLISWQMVLIQSADSTRVIDPVLAAARGTNVYFHQICIQSGKISLLFLRHISLSYSLLAVHWMGPKTIATVDRNEMLHLTDVRTTKESECIDIANAGLVYGSAHFKGFATGGNVSPAFALAGTYACYNSVISKGSQLYVLGARSLQSINVRSWSDRITHLAQNQRWCEACSLAIEGYRSAGDRSRRKQMAKDRVIQLVEEYLTASARCPELCLNSIMACLIEIQEYEMLWQELWERLTTKDTYIILLSEQIENGNISYISPVVSQCLCEYWLKQSPVKLEEIILKLDWQCLDLHQVLSAAKREKLYRAQMHLNTVALGDYCLSLTELIPQITHENDRNLGNYLLVYISSCLSGRGYPSGYINPEIIQNVKHEVLRCLTSIHSIRAVESELPYPYLRALLIFDSQETLNVISLAFQEKEFSGELGQSHRQRIVNILLDIMSPEHFQWTEIGCLLNFVAHEIAANNLPDDSVLLQKVLDYVKMEKIENESARQHSDREQAWLALLEADRINTLSLSEHLTIARQSKCYRVVEHLLEKQKSFNQILDCYLLDPHRHNEVWSYLQLQANRPERKIFQQCHDHFAELLRISSEKVTQFMIEFFPRNVGQLIRLLAADETNLFAFISMLLKHGISINSNDCETYLNLLCRHDVNSVDGFLRTNENYRLETAIEIVKKYELHDCLIYLYERQGDIDAAFNLSLEMLQATPEGMAENRALELSALCSRSLDVLSNGDREKLWFTLIRTVLSRNDLNAITKSILHAASGHVDLTNLVQLVLTSSSETGNLGDIKHLLVGMLANSKYEILLQQTTARILGHDLHRMLAQEKRIANRGLSIKSIKCILCRSKLYNQQESLIFGLCGHAAHHSCVQEMYTESDKKLQCPRCDNEIHQTKPVELAKPNDCFYENNANDSCSLTLQLEAPPRSIG